MKAYGSTDKHLGASQLKIYWLSSVLHILLAIIKWHLFYVFFKKIIALCISIQFES